MNVNELNEIVGRISNPTLIIESYKQELIRIRIRTWKCDPIVLENLKRHTIIIQSLIDCLVSKNNKMTA